MQLAINQIRMDGGTQPRATTDMFTVDEYATAMRDGALFPPVTVFYDGSDYWLADGFHRIEAAKRAGLTEIGADVRPGDVSAAQWYSLGVNQTHGLRRSNEDKQHAVKAALMHPKSISLSNTQIARHCGVAESSVRIWRAQLEATSQIAKSSVRTGADGRVIDISNIGRKIEPPQIERLPFDADYDDDEPLSPYEQQLADRYQPEPEPVPIAPIVVPQVEVVRIGRHVIIYGDNRDQQTLARLMAEIDGAASLAFLDPPYNAGVAEWDDGSFVWQHDHFINLARVVAVTPGIGNIPGFMRETEMPYKWSTAAFIKNGMTRGAIGFGNWMYTAIFSHSSIYRQRQDIQLITINPSDAAESGAKRQKPPQYLQWLFDLFTTPGDTIIDGFGGSGTSVLVAEKMGRRCICIERDPQSFGQIVERVRGAIEETVQEAA